MRFAVIIHCPRRPSPSCLLSFPHIMHRFWKRPCPSGGPCSTILSQNVEIWLHNPRTRLAQLGTNCLYHICKVFLSSSRILLRDESFLNNFQFPRSKLPSWGLAAFSKDHIPAAYGSGKITPGKTFCLKRFAAPMLIES